MADTLLTTDGGRPPDSFYAATARQIAREFAGLPLGPGLDRSPRLPRSPLPLLRVDEINWEMAPTPRIPYEDGDLRASTIAYREIAQGGCHALHDLQRRHDRLLHQHHQVQDVVRRLRPRLPPTSLETVSSEPRKQTRLPMTRLVGVRGVQGVRGL